VELDCKEWDSGIEIFDSGIEREKVGFCPDSGIGKWNNSRVAIQQ
jgi:hypothetical protein